MKPGFATFAVMSVLATGSLTAQDVAPSGASADPSVAQAPVVAQAPTSDQTSAQTPPVPTEEVAVTGAQAAPTGSPASPAADPSAVPLTAPLAGPPDQPPTVSAGPSADAPAETMPAPAPLAVPPMAESSALRDPAAAIEDLRAQFTDLDSRRERIAALHAPADPATMERIASVEADIAAAEGPHATAVWRAQTFEYFATAIAARPALVLPGGVPPGTRPDIALAYVDAQTTLYSQPDSSAETALRTLEAPTTVLRIAELGAFTLIWSAQDDFAFVLSQFRKVY